MEAARAIDPRESFRVASKDRTCAVLNTHKQPTVYTLLGTQDFDPEKLREQIFSHCREDYSYAKKPGRPLASKRLGSKQYSNIDDAGASPINWA